MAHEPSWWLVIILGLLTLAAGGASWYLVAFTSADATRFMDLAYIGFGAVVALAVPPAVSAVRAVGAASETKDAPEDPADRAFMAARQAQRAEADAQLVATLPPPS
jgi:hypothetical protein